MPRKLEYEASIHDENIKSELKKIESELNRITKKMDVYNKNLKSTEDTVKKMEDVNEKVGIDDSRIKRIEEYKQEIEGLKQKISELSSKQNSLDELKDKLNFNNLDFSPDGNSVGSLSEVGGIVQRLISKLSVLPGKVKGAFSAGKIAVTSLKAGLAGLIVAVGLLIAKFVELGMQVAKSLAIGVVNSFKNAIVATAQRVFNVFSGLGGIVKNLASKLFNSGLSYVETGLKNIALVSYDTRNALNSLTSSASYFRNSFAAMIAPLASMVAPIFEKIVDSIVGAMNALSRFFAMLAGKSSYTKAIRQTSSLGGAIGGAGSAAKDASENELDAAKNAKKTAKEQEKALASFDEINQLHLKDQKDMEDAYNSPKTPSGSGGGGGGGSGTGGLAFIEEALDNDKLKDLLEGLDWFELGEMVAKKLTELLKVFDNWITTTLRPWLLKWAQRISTFVNGLFSFDELFEMIGKTFANLTNVLAEAYNKLVDDIDFNKIGEQIWRSIDNFIKDLNAEQIGHMLANLWNPVIDTFSGFAQNFANSAYGWGVKIGEIFSRWAEHIHLDQLGTAIGNALNGIARFIKGFVDSGGLRKALDEITKGINNFLETFNPSEFASSISSLITEVCNWLKTLDWTGIGVAIGEVIGGLPWGEVLLTAGKIIIDTLFGIIFGELKAVGGKISEALNGIGESVQEGWMSLLNIFGNDATKSYLAEQGYETGKLAGDKLMEGEMAGIDEGKPVVTEKASSTFNEVDTTRGLEKGREHGDAYSSAAAEAIEAGKEPINSASDRMFDGIDLSTNRTFHSANQTTQQGVNQMGSTVAVGAGNMVTSMQSAGDGMSSAMSTAMDNVNNTVSTKTGETLAQLATNANLTVAELSATLQLTTIEQMDVLGQIILMAVGTISEGLKAKVTEVMTMLNTTVISKLETTLQQFQAKVNTFLITVKTKITTEFNTISQRITESMNRASNSVVSACNRMVMALRRVYETVVMIIQALSQMSGAMGAIGIGGPTFSGVNVPHLATGTVIPPNAGEFMAMLGDNKTDTEVVSPLGTIKQAVVEALAEVGGIGGGDVVIKFDGTMSEFVRLLKPELDSENKRVGVSLVVDEG